MKRLSLQWRITLMSVLLIGITCVAMNLLLCSSGVYYMDTIADSLQGGGTVILNDGGAASFDPAAHSAQRGVDHRRRWGAGALPHHQLVHHGGGNAAQRHPRLFRQRTRSQAPAQLYLAGGAVQLNNLADMRIDEDAISEFRQLSRSFNQMLERLNNAFSAQRQFTGNAAHELRTPLALMQAQLELFSAEHPDVRRRRRSSSRFCVSRRNG